MSLNNSPNEGMEYPGGLQGKFAAMKDEVEAAYYQTLPLKKPEDIVPVTNDEYKTECEVLPKGFLEINVYSVVPQDYSYLTNGMRCSVAILPFSDSCAGRAALEVGERWEKFISDRDYLRFLVVNSNGLGTRFEGDRAGYWYELLPEVLKKDVSEGGCTFSINYPMRRVPNRSDEMDERSPAAQNRVWLLQQVNMALENLKKFFGQDFGSEPDTQLH